MDTRKVEAKLAKVYEYRRLPSDLSAKYRQWYDDNTPSFLKRSTQQPLYTSGGTLICDYFDRIVIGDYGAFVEFSKEAANEDVFVIAPGQEYRLNDPKYSANVKYIWLTVNDESQIKIYRQKRRVSYADYTPSKYYVSVHEVFGPLAQLVSAPGS